MQKPGDGRIVAVAIKIVIVKVLFEEQKYII